MRPPSGASTPRAMSPCGPIVASLALCQTRILALGSEPEPVSYVRAFPVAMTMSLWFETALLQEGWTPRVRLSLAHGRIARIETGVEPGASDERHAIGIPGLSNLHS